MSYFVNKKKTVRFTHVPCFYATLLECAYFCNKIEKCQLCESFKYFNILWPMKNKVRFEHVQWKNVWFCLISIVWVHFSHKIEQFQFSKSLKYFNVFMKNGARFKYVPWKDVWFLLFPLFRFTLVIKMRNFVFENIEIL